MRIILFWLICVMSCCLTHASETLKKSVVPIRVYALNCGYINIHDGYDFSDTGVYPHRSLYFANPCFLIAHPQGWLLWDTGLGDKYAGQKFVDTKHGATLEVPVALTAQLKQLGLTPQDIKYVGVSHTHFDHTGNTDLFKKSTWIIQRAEYQSLQQAHLSPVQESTTAKILQAQKVNKILLDGDYDLFNDQSVVVLRTPGHTIGHQSLKINLPHSGIIILSGDLYHTDQAYKFKLLPVFNNSRADTLASMLRIDGILDNTHGRLIIQHDLNYFNAFPKFPQYLD